MNETAVSYLTLGYTELGLAALLVLVNGALSALLGLGMERRMLLAAGRTVVQLLLLGLVLRWVFELEHWLAVAGVMSLMVIAAGRAALSNVSRPYVGLGFDTLLAMGLGAWTMALYALTIVVRPEPWYLPQYAVPLIGMMLGNSLNGILLGLERFTEELTQQRTRVEGYLALGATRWKAALPSIRQAVRTGLVPITNTMMVVGIVSLPGMMTGQLLAGAKPSDAVKYQIVIMFLIASATAIGTVCAVLLAYRRLFSEDHQFLHHRLSKRG